MFKIPTGATNDATAMSEEWNGIPTVKMLDDKDEDVYNLLMTLYDRK